MGVTWQKWFSLRCYCCVNKRLCGLGHVEVRWRAIVERMMEIVMLWVRMMTSQTSKRSMMLAWSHQRGGWRSLVIDHNTLMLRIVKLLMGRGWGRRRAGSLTFRQDSNSNSPSRCHVVESHRCGRNVVLLLLLLQLASFSFIATILEPNFHLIS